MRNVTAGTFTELLSALDSDELRRGKQFEKIVKWWLQNDTARSRNIKTVWLWDEWPDRPGRDIGVDLVAELLDGSLCAIQAKCFASERDVPKSEIDSFISAASPRTFAQRWLVATTNGLSANARRTIHDNHVTFVPLAELEAAAVTWPTNPNALKAAKKQTRAKPRLHQQRAIRDVLKGLEANDKGQLIMACGTGKTLTALWITEHLDSQTTLVLVPSLNLLSQTLTEWAHNTSTKWSYICVCSDDTVNKEDDQPINTTVDLPYPVTTKPSEIADFLKRRGTKIVFSTYQSSAQVAKAQKLSRKKFELVICDEAHRLTGKTEADYATVLDEKKIISKKRLFMTATPRTYTAGVKAMAEERGVEITSMDDADVYGPQFHRLTFGEAIKQELLTDYQVVIVGVTDPQVQELIDRRELVSVNNTVTTDARTLAAHIGLAKATKDFNLARTISFHSRIKTAAQFASDHPKILEWLPTTHKPEGTIWTDTISGAMNTGQRRSLLQLLRRDQPGRHALLTNARCLTEGVDVPTLDGVAFIDPRSSQVDIIQAVGRAIRRSTSKNIGTIVLPVLIPDQADPDEALSDSAFTPIWSILNALKSHDQELSEELNKLRTALGRTAEPQDLPKKIVFDLPANIDSLIPNFTEKLRISVLEHSTESWEWWFGLLQQFAESNGHCRVPRKKRSRKAGDESTIDRLASWVLTQRMNHQQGTLSALRANRLSLLPGWVWSVHDYQWQHATDLLRNFVKREGHTAVPQKHVEDGFKLGLWLTNVRQRRHKISDSKIFELESLPGWTWNPDDAIWETRFEELLQLANETGTARAPNRGAGSIGLWIEIQRSRYKRGTLSESQTLRLKSLPGWSWHTKLDAWESAYQLLADYASTHGTCQVPVGYRVSGIDLHAWKTKQIGRISTYTHERQRKLRALPEWKEDLLEERWRERFELLARHTAKNGSADIPGNLTVSGIKLGNWVSTQRLSKAAGTLTGERQQMLESLPGWTWDPIQDRWMSSFEALQAYSNQHGHSNPPRGQKYNGQTIGKFARVQRGKKTRLHSSKISMLESLPGWTWSLRDTEWEQGFSLLLNYTREHGSSDVPQEASHLNFALGKWVASQRRQFWKSAISEERRSRLETLAGWKWNSSEARRTESIDQGIAALQIFFSQHDHYKVPRDTSIDGFPLGRWTNNLRQRYKTGALRPDEIAKIDKLRRWSWNPLDDNWETMFHLIAKYIAETGNADVPYSLVIKNMPVGVWVSNQRALHRKGKLSSQRSARLSILPGWSWARRKTGPRKV